MVLAIMLSWFFVYFWGFSAAFSPQRYVADGLRWLVSTTDDVLNKELMLLVSLLLPVLLFGLLYEFVDQWLFGLAGLGLSFFAIAFASGRFYYFDQVALFKEALEQQDREQVLRIARRLGVVEADDDDLDTIYLRARQLLCFRAFSQWFSAIVWFLLLGAAGVFFYGICRAVATLMPADFDGVYDYDDDDDDDEEENRVRIHFISERAASLLYWLDWLSVRGWLLVFALASDFSRVFAVIRQSFFTANSHVELLDRANTAVLEGELATEQPTINEFDFQSKYLEMKKLESNNNSAMMVSLVVVLVVVAIF